MPVHLPALLIGAAAIGGLSALIIRNREEILEFIEEVAYDIAENLNKRRVAVASGSVQSSQYYSTGELYDVEIENLAPYSERSSSGSDLNLPRRRNLKKPANIFEESQLMQSSEMFDDGIYQDSPSLSDPFSDLNRLSEDDHRISSRTASELSFVELESFHNEDGSLSRFNTNDSFNSHLSSGFSTPTIISESEYRSA